MSRHQNLRYTQTDTGTLHKLFINFQRLSTLTWLFCLPALLGRCYSQTRPNSIWWDELGCSPHWLRGKVWDQRTVGPFSTTSELRLDHLSCLSLWQTQLCFTLQRCRGQCNAVKMYLSDWKHTGWIFLIITIRCSCWENKISSNFFSSQCSKSKKHFPCSP